MIGKKANFSGRVDFDFSSESANIWLNFNNGYAGCLEFKNSFWSFSVVNEYYRMKKRSPFPVGRNNFKQYARLHNCWKTWNLHNHDLLETVVFVSSWRNPKSETLYRGSLTERDFDVRQTLSKTLTFLSGGLGLQHNLENGLTVSVIMHDMSYGGNRGLWELGVWQTENPDRWMTKDIFNSDDDVVGFMKTRRVGKYLQTVITKGEVH